METRIYALALLALAACDDGDTAEDRRLSSAVRPFSVCDADVSPAPPLRCVAGEGERDTVLAVCGDLTAHNTLTVEGGQSADTGVWVQGTTHNSAPLSIEGNLWTEGNDPTNTQNISGAIQSGQTLGCSAAPRVATFLDGVHARPTSEVVPGERNPLDDDDDLDEDHDEGVDHDDGSVRITVPTELTLEPCQYTHSALEVDNTLDVHVTGHVTWVITGNVRIAAPLEITLDEGASLDMIIGGSLAADNTFSVGDGARPEATWLAVGGSIRIAAPTKVHGSLYAPDSQVAADNTLAVDGAAYVGSTRVAAPMVVGGAQTFSERGCLR